MGRTIYAPVGPFAAASANNIALSQSLAGAGKLNLNGSTAGVLDKARRIAIASNGNDSGLTWTIVGLNFGGQPATEKLIGGNIATVASVLDYTVVTSITGSAATASTVTAGTSNATPLGSSPWIRLDEWSPGPCVIDVEITGTVNYTVESSQNDPNSLFTPIAPAAMRWTTGLFMSAFINSTINWTNSIPASPLWIRISLNSGTGSAKLAVTQMGPP